MSIADPLERRGEIGPHPPAWLVDDEAAFEHLTKIRCGAPVRPRRIACDALLCGSEGHRVPET